MQKQFSLNIVNCFNASVRWFGAALFLYIGFKDPVEVLKSDTIVSLGPNIGKIKNTAVLNQIARGGPESLKTTIKDHAGTPNYKGKVNTYEAGYKGNVSGYPFYRFNTKQFNNYIAKIRNNNE